MFTTTNAITPSPSPISSSTQRSHMSPSSSARHYAHKAVGQGDSRSKSTVMPAPPNSPYHSHGKSKSKGKSSPLRKCTNRITSVCVEHDSRQVPLSGLGQEGNRTTNPKTIEKGKGKGERDPSSSPSSSSEGTDLCKEIGTEERLHKLIKSIDAVYRGYSSIPSSAYGVGEYMISLSNLYKRARELLESQIHLDSSQSNSQMEKEKEKIERLEKEWYVSDIAASWYGPCPRPSHTQHQHQNQARKSPFNITSTSRRPLTHTRTHTQFSYSRTPSPPKHPKPPTATNAKDALTSALADMSLSKDHMTNTNNTNKYDVPTPTTRVDLFNLQRRDASYVGLNDE